jgi:hypothetical protein
LILENYASSDELSSFGAYSHSAKDEMVLRPNR